MRHRFVVRVAAVAALALFAGACGGGKGVGSDLNKKGLNGTGNNAIGQVTTTVPPTTVPPTTAKPAPTTTRPVAPSAVYTINDDDKGQYIEPLRHQVTAGSLVRFTNADDIAHQVSGVLGGAAVFNSPLIPPGGSWDVRPTTRGTIDLVDQQRTYAQGVTLVVV